MDHMEATQSKAVERYLLGEMSVLDRGRFEEHFFTCGDCAEEVRAAAIFADNARAVFSGQARASLAHSHAGTEAGAGWFGWLWRPAFTVPLAAGLLLTVSVASYQNLVVIPQLRREVAQATAPQVLPSYALKSVARGNDQVIVIPKGSLYFHLLLDKTWEQSAVSYRCELQDASGKAQITLDVPPSDPLNLLLPVARLTAGSYTLLVRAPGGAELARHPFDLQFQ
jgi:hypothetical protein